MRVIVVVFVFVVSLMAGCSGDGAIFEAEQVAPVVVDEKIDTDLSSDYGDSDVSEEPLLSVDTPVPVAQELPSLGDLGVTIISSSLTGSEEDVVIQSIRKGLDSVDRWLLDEAYPIRVVLCYKSELPMANADGIYDHDKDIIYLSSGSSSWLVLHELGHKLYGGSEEIATAFANGETITAPLASSMPKQTNRTLMTTDVTLSVSCNDFGYTVTASSYMGKPITGSVMVSFSANYKYDMPAAGGSKKNTYSSLSIQNATVYFNNSTSGTANGMFMGVWPGSYGFKVSSPYVFACFGTIED